MQVFSVIIKTRHEGEQLMWATTDCDAAVACAKSLQCDLYDDQMIYVQSIPANPCGQLVTLEIYEPATQFKAIEAANSKSHIEESQLRESRVVARMCSTVKYDRHERSMCYLRSRNGESKYSGKLAKNQYNRAVRREAKAIVQYYR